MVHTLTGALQTTGSIAIQRSQKLRRHRAPNGLDRHSSELLLHIAECAGPLRAFEAFSSSGNGHGAMAATSILS